VAIRKVGDCRILGELGKGGMGVVYKGVHEALQREVAIKELPAELAKNKEALSRFRREAIALAGFRHQNIVTLYDLVEKNDALYMVMELVDGPTLTELIKEGPLPPEVAAVMTLQLAAALEHAHFARIIHRDLKPSNVMVSKQGEVKLMDFGIAKDQQLDPLTRTGMAVGTPAYMSPEQVSGGDVDARTDLYSLGLVLYEMLSGIRAYSGSSPGEIFAKVALGNAPPLKKVAPSVPAELRAIVARATQKSPAKRYFDAAELRRALERFVAKRVKISEPALLVGFLHQRHKVTDTEALARLTQTEMTVAQRLEAAPAKAVAQARRRWPLRVAVTVLALGASAYLSWPWWLPLVQSHWARLFAP
jgi:serine/threonine protein kinase